jgi:hypothetical protein
MDNNKSHHLKHSAEADRTLAETSIQHHGKVDAQDSRDQAERSSEERKMLRSTRKVLVPRTLKRTRIQKLAFGRTKDFNIDATMSTTSLKRAPSSKVQGTKINQSATDVTNKKDLEQIVIQKCKRVQQLSSGIVKDFKADPTISPTLLEQAHSTVRSTMLHHSTVAPSHAEDLGQLEMLKSTRIKKLPPGKMKDFRADATISTTSLKQAPSKVQSTDLNRSASLLSKGRDLEQIEVKKENVDDCNDVSHGIELSTSSRPTSSSSIDFTNISGRSNSLKLISTEKKLQTYVSHGIESSSNSRPTTSSSNDFTNKSGPSNSLKLISTEKKLQTYISHGIESSTNSRPTTSSSNDFTNKSGLPNSLKLISTEKKLQTLHRGRWKDAGQF